MATGTRIEPDDIDANKNIVLPASGGTAVLGVIFDEQGLIPTRGRFCAWSPKAGTRDGIVGFFGTLAEADKAIAALYDTPAEPAPERITPAPEWRTLKGLAAPFHVHAKQRNGRIRPTGDRRTPTGEPVEVVRLELRGSCRYGYTADNREIYFGGTATKCWVASGSQKS